MPAASSGRVAAIKPTGRRRPPPAIRTDVVQAVRSAKLRYVTDEAPGIARRRRGEGWLYLDPAGRVLRNRATQERIRHLAIPPAWTDVWICPLVNGHIQATGRDARGRKQYLYHADWRETRDEEKFTRMLAFARALPRIRRRVARDLARPDLDRRRVLAAVVRLLETTFIRIGNEEYARENGSFGLTTLRSRHVAVGRGMIHFEFRGKSGKRHAIDLGDPQLARVVRRIQELPGQDLFQYVDDKGAPQKIESADVNAYLREIAGEEFSAKDFRTWAGTVLAAMALREAGPFSSATDARRRVSQAIAWVADRLGNTPAICRKAYIHPGVLESYLKGVTIGPPPRGDLVTGRAGLPELRSAEAGVLALLRRRSAAARRGRVRRQIAGTGQKKPAR